jgi:hypothetical protein
MRPACARSCSRVRGVGARSSCAVCWVRAFGDLDEERRASGERCRRARRDRKCNVIRNSEFALIRHTRSVAKDLGVVRPPSPQMPKLLPQNHSASTT